VERLQERRRRARQLLVLRLAGELVPRGQDLIARWLLLERDEHGSHVAIADRNADALGGDHRRGGGHDLSVLDRAPHLERLSLALLLFTFDEGNDVVDHLGPGLERLAGTSDRLIGADRDLGGLERLERVDRWNVALD